MIKTNFQQLRPSDVIKFVCSDEEDFRYALEVVQQLTTEDQCRATIYFHAVGGLPLPWLTDKVLEERWMMDRFVVRVGVQLHKLIWGPERTGV